MELPSIFYNQVLIAGLTAWSLAQFVKVPLDFIHTRRINWALLFATGGMPSSHSALVAATAHSTGLNAGFDSAVFAVSVAIAMVVIYDATGIRRQAGRHAAIINAIIRDLASGHPLQEEQLREVLGHTPLQAFMGTILGIVIAQLFWFIWNR